MKQGWKLETVGNVCTIVNGGTPKTGVPKYWDGGHLWLTPKDMGKLASNFVSDTSRKITDEGLRNSSAKLLPIDSIVLSSRAPIGHLAINKKPISTNQGCKGLVPKNGIDTKFVFFFLKNSVELLNDLGSGTTFKELSGTKLSSIEIPIPPLPEQNRIVAKLEQAFTAIDQAKSNVERNLQNANDLFQSELNMIFSQKGDGWVEKKLGDVCYIIGGGTPSKKVEEYYNGSIPWATVRDMNVELLTETEHKITKLGLDKSSANVITAGNVIIATRVGLGKICLLGKDTAINQDLKGIIPKNKKNQINEKFLFWWFKNTSAEIIKAGTGLTVQGVKIPFIQALLFPIVPLSVQNDIVLRLDEINAQKKTLIFSYQQELEFLDELRKSILQKAFNGEL